jgi:3-oxoacyl-[acyl-carrier protein] reductase
MDFGLRGRTAIVCAASMGLGKACAVALGTEGVKLVIVARRREILERAAEEIRAVTDADTVAVAADVTTREGRDAILAACPAPDILVNNAGGPPAGDFRNWERGDWIKALDANMLAPIELMKSTIDGMIARQFGRIVNITSHAVKAPIAMLGLSNGARSGLTGFVAGLARANAEHNVTINNLLPGTVRYRPAEVKSAGARSQHETFGRGGDPGYPLQQSITAIRPPRGVWRRLRVLVLGASRLHHGTEYSH